MLAFYIIISSTKVDNMQMLGRYNDRWVGRFFWKIKNWAKGSKSLIKEYKGFVDK
jgi:hypothetical protein